MPALVKGRGKVQQNPGGVLAPVERNKRSTRNRFEGIRRFLRFDDRQDRKEKEADGVHVERISLISEIFTPFRHHLKHYFVPGDQLVVDEMLVKFRGRTKWRVYMKSKPGKYGMKAWGIVDKASG